MKYLKSIITCFILLLATSCSTSYLQKKGDVQPKNFDYSFQFDTIKSIIIIPVTINGVTKNFLFDTGAELTVIQRDTLKGSTMNVKGGSKREMKLGKEIVPAIQIGTINFRNTSAINGDLVGLKEQIPNFGGIIGQSIISKANWLIDYPNKKMTISNKVLVDDTFQPIVIIKENEVPYTDVSINGKKYKAIIDLGSSSFFSIPKASKLADEIQNIYIFKENIREIYTLGGLQTVTEKKGIIPAVELGNIKFLNIQTAIRDISKVNIGSRFFTNYILYINNTHNTYKIKKSN